jgi:hypothetical protein
VISVTAFLFLSSSNGTILGTPDELKIPTVMLPKTNTKGKIEKASSYLEEHYPVLYNSVGGKRVKKILREIVFKKREQKKRMLV